MTDSFVIHQNDVVSVVVNPDDVVSVVVDGSPTPVSVVMVAGPQGPPGVPGLPGLPGVQGPPGPQGDTGTYEFNGVAWFFGAGPPTPSPIGAKEGDYYIDTNTGTFYVLGGS